MPAARRTSSFAVFLGALTLAVGLAVTGILADAPIDTTTAIVINPNPVVVGDPSPTITATTVATGTGQFVTPGKLRIKRMVDDVTFNPVACGTLNSHAEIFDEDDPTDGILVNTSADTSAIGSFGYLVQYVPATGTGFHESQSACINLDVTPPVCSGLQIAATAAAGTNVPTPGSTWNGGFEITVTNCGPRTAPGVTAQGGSSGWTTVTGVNPNPGLAGVKTTKGKTTTQIIQWSIGDMLAGAVAKIGVTETGFVKAGAPSGTVFYLNGPWSAVSGGVKTDYTGRITVTAP
jgi:hypothetical protein